MAYDKEEEDIIFEKICNEISNGVATRKAIKNNNISTQTFYKWIDSDANKSKHYARACDERTELKFESIEADYSETPMRDPESGRIDPAWVQLQKLKIDSKKWELSKLMPKKYGDKVEVEDDPVSKEAKKIEVVIHRKNVSDGD